MVLSNYESEGISSCLKKTCNLGMYVTAQAFKSTCLHYFQVLLCIRLEYLLNLSLYYVMIPAWLFLAALVIDVSLALR